MKSTHYGGLNLLSRLACGGIALFASAVAVASSQSRASPITFTVRCENPQHLTVTIQNAGTEDTAVIFGSVLANGAKYLIHGLTLEAISRGGARNQYTYFPRDYPAGIAGRVDDWIVPLPAGASYVIPATPSEFLSNTDGRLSKWPEPAQLSLKLPIRTPNPRQNSDVVGLRLYRVWRGTEALISNDLTTPAQCN